MFYKNIINNWFDTQVIIFHYSLINHFRTDGNLTLKKYINKKRAFQLEMFN